MIKQLLLIDCPDEAGLIHKITGVLYRLGGNIIGNFEFVDINTTHFFMRTEFSSTTLLDTLVQQVKNVLPPKANVRLTMMNKRPIVIMATKEPHCLGDLLLRQACQELPVEIRAVISNYDTLRPLVEQFGVPFHFINYDKPRRRSEDKKKSGELNQARQEHEADVLQVLNDYQPDYIVLAKYMRVLSPEFVERYSKRIINIHHSFLPAFSGAQPYRQAYERGVKVIGATAHIVTDELDAGPILAQGVLSVDHGFTAEDMARAGRDIEKIVLAKAVKLILEERVFIHGNRTVICE